MELAPFGCERLPNPATGQQCQGEQSGHLLFRPRAKRGRKPGHLSLGQVALARVLLVSLDALGRVVRPHPLGSEKAKAFDATASTRFAMTAPCRSVMSRC